MFLLGLLTQIGLTTETTAKWSEIGVTAEAADTFGLQVLGVALAVLSVGWILGKLSGENK